MAYTKRIVCLANSWKRGGSCIAGKEVDGKERGMWIRPVSGRATHEISVFEQRCQDGTFTAVLDIIEVTLQAHVPVDHQTENHVIAPGQPWKKVGRAALGLVAELTDKPLGDLWINGISSGRGLNDEVPLSLASKLNCSLYLLKPDGLTLDVGDEPAFSGGMKRKVRACFLYEQREYRLAVTDPEVVNAYRKKADGFYSVANALICVSLAEPLDSGKCYKLVAAIIT